MTTSNSSSFPFTSLSTIHIKDTGTSSQNLKNGKNYCYWKEILTIEQCWPSVFDTVRTWTCRHKASQSTTADLRSGPPCQYNHIYSKMQSWSFTLSHTGPGPLAVLYWEILPTCVSVYWGVLWGQTMKGGQDGKAWRLELDQAGSL
jgi:hypothetical protein